MSSTFWFLLEFTVLLALVAVVFGVLGWMWRGSDRGTRLAQLEKDLEEQRRLARAAMDERDALRTESKEGSVHVSDAARLIHENETLEANARRLSDDLSAARRELAVQSDAAAKAREAQTALEAENAKLQSENADLLSNSGSAAQALEAELAALKASAAEKAAQAAREHESALQAAKTQIDDLQRQLDTRAATAEKSTAELQTSLQGAQTTIQRLEADLAAARTDSTAQDNARREIAALQQQLASTSDSSQSAIQRLETELATARQASASLQQQLAAVQAEITTLRARPMPAPEAPVVAAPAVEAAPAAPAVKPPKIAKPKAPAAPKKPARPSAASAQEKLAQIALDLAPQLSVLAALTQERDDWKRRVATLEAKTPPDLAGLALARRSLAGSEERLATAQHAAASLQNQHHALEKAIAQSAALTPEQDDDLTRIKGIKKVLSDQLQAHGIRTWDQIAGWSEDDLNAFSELLAFKNRATRDHWQDQARELIAGRHA